MLSHSLGDLMQANLLSRRTANVSTNLARLADEIASGKRQDLQSHVRGDFTLLAGLERDIALGAALQDSNAAAGRFAAAQQSALDIVADSVATLGPDFAKAASSGSAHHLATAFEAGESALAQTISALNVRMDGKAVFAGADTGGNALENAETLIAALEVELTGATDAADAMNRADTWFGSDTGFGNMLLFDKDVRMAEMDIGATATEKFTLTAGDSALRDTLKAQAVAAVMGRGLFSGDAQAQADLLGAASDKLLNVVDDISVLRADIGYREQRIETERVRNEARGVALETARAAIRDVDPYEAAIELRQAETQLSALFQITARLSNLSLVSVLR